MNQELKTILSGDLQEYRSIPFWSWNNALDPQVLVQQIRQMKAAGVGGFIMHARLGFSDEYLGEKWFECVEACLDEAKALGMGAWVYDENGWPSGFVGGKLLERVEYRARFLEMSTGAFDEAAFAVFAEDPKLGFRRVTAPARGVDTYHNVYLRVSPANTDILNPAVVDAFIRETHEEYYKRFPERFGRELVGFFTDEPQFYRWATPYTPMAEEIFAAEGEDIRDGLIWLFRQDPRGYGFRQKYYGVLSDLYVKNFYKKLYDWCGAHNCKLTGHTIEEAALFAQMWGGAAVMPTYEFEDIPAMDSLGRNCVPEQAPKQVSSVAAQLGKRQVLTETFACTGFDVTPGELRSIGQSQYFQGVNLMCQHLYPYSIAGQGRVDHPQVFGPQGNWFEQFKTFNDYFARLGCIVTNTDENVDIAILHPIREIWLEYTRSGERDSVAEAEDAFYVLLRTLRMHGITYHFVDEAILASHGSTAPGVLRVGKCAYGTLLIPKMRTLSAHTYALLKQFSGKLCILGELGYIDGIRAPVELRSNTTLEEILARGAVGFHCPDGNSVLTSRSGSIGDFLFIQNNSLQEPSTVILENVAQRYVALDLETLREEKISNRLCLEPGGSRILVRSPDAEPVEETWEETDITGQFAVRAVSENFLVMDYGRLSKNSGEFGPRKPIARIFEELLREDYKGPAAISHEFTVRAPVAVKLVMERAKFLSVKVNGHDVTFHQSDFDINFLEADITDAIRVGKNELIYAIDFWQHEGVRFALFDPLATESLRNCLYYDTSFEPVYLKGDFVVLEDLSLGKATGLPVIGTPLKDQGYPFFKGTMTLEGSLNWSGAGRAVLKLDGRYLAAELTVNGQRTDLALDTKKDITDLLKPGENRLAICLRASLRNLFGPHHFKCDGDLMGVSPTHFHFRGQWDGGIPENYTDDYMLVPFGPDKLRLTVRKEQ